MKARTRLTLTTLTLVSIAVGAAPANAQDTRAEEIRQQQAERQQQVYPPQPNFAERTIDRLEKWGFISGPPRGVYPWMGSIYPGGGVAAGAGLRTPFGDDGALNVFAGYSIRSYTIGQADVALPTFAKNRGTAHGVGPVHRRDRREVLRRRQRDEQGRPHILRVFACQRRHAIRLRRQQAFQGRRRGLVSRRRHVGGPTAPSIDAQFGSADTPGLEFSQFSFINSTARASFDWRRAPRLFGQRRCLPRAVRRLPRPRSRSLLIPFARG